MSGGPVDLGRRVDVPLRRLDPWLAGFRRRHPDVVIEALDPIGGASRWLLTAGDGERACIEVPAYLSAAVGSSRIAGELPGERSGAFAGPTFAVLFARRAGYAMAVFSGTDQVAAKVGTRHIHGRTAAGGWSQQRYARRRANQADELAGAVADSFGTIVGPHAAAVAMLVTGGDRALLTQVRGLVAAARTHPALDRVLATVPEIQLGIGAPTKDVLAGVPDRALAVRVHLTGNIRAQPTDQPDRCHRRS